MKVKIKKNYQEIYFLPSLFTLTNLFFGFMSIQMSLRGRFGMAAVWIVAAAIMDGFDGIVARSTKTQSDFGAELDSLSDVISFGLAASLLVFRWGLSKTGAAGIFFSFIFLSASALRLARYNVRTRIQPDRKFFQGLPVPSAAVFLASCAYFSPRLVMVKEIAFLLALLTILMAFLMVSTLPYRNFMHLIFHHRIDIKGALFLAIILSFLIFYPKIFLVSFSSLNVLSGPVVGLARLLKKKRVRKPRPKEILS